MSSNFFSNAFGLFGGIASGMSTGMSAAAAYREAEAANRAAEWNASIEDMNADWYRLMGEDALARGEKEAGDHRRSVRVLMGKQRAGYANSVVKVDTGSALDVAMDTVKWGEYDAQTILYNAAVEKAGYDQKAANSSMSASMLRQTRRSPTLAAGSVVLNGVSSALTRYGNW